MRCIPLVFLMLAGVFGIPNFLHTGLWCLGYFRMGYLRDVGGMNRNQIQNQFSAGMEANLFRPLAIEWI